MFIMKKEMEKLVLLIILSFSFPLVSAFGAVSNDYSVGSYHTGIAGGQNANSNYTSRYTLTYQQGSGEANSSDYTANIGWFFYPGYCGDNICSIGETCSSCTADCACSSGYTCSGGACTAVSGVASGARGAETSSCTNDWVCSEWYPEPCPTERIQKRVCVNRGTCSETTGMPDVKRECISGIISPAEPLFDLFVKIPINNKWVIRGDKVTLDIKLNNLGNTTPLDVFFKYWIVDENNHLVAEMQETRAIGEKSEFKIEIPISEVLKTGFYKVYVQINYDDKIAIAEDSFEVVKGRILAVMNFVFKAVILPFILPFMAAIILIFIIVKIVRRKKFEEKKPKRKQKKTEEKGISIFESFIKLRERMHKARMRKIEFREKIRKIRQQREAERRALEEKERRLLGQRIARRRTLEEKKKMEERLREERRKSYRERKIMQERLNRKTERRNIKSFNLFTKKEKKAARKKKKKYIHLTLKRGEHEERVRLEE